MSSNTAQAAVGTSRQIVTGAAWMVLFKLADKILGLASTLILVRLLVPADFGLMAMAMSVVALTQLMGAFGFDTALIQRQDCRKEHYDTAWTFSVILGIAIAVFLVLLAIPAAAIYNEPRLKLLLPALAISSLVGGFENVGTVAFRKDLNFRAEFRFLLIRRFATFAVTVGLAVVFKTYWALVAGTITGRIASVYFSYRMHPYRPSLTLQAKGDLLHFSKWLFISNCIYFLQGKTMEFVLGRTVGAHALGIYNIGAEIATMPSTEMIAPINRVIYPAYAKLSKDLEQLQKRFIEILQMICAIGFPVAIGLFLFADEVVRLALGPNWLEAIPIVRIIAFSGLVGAVQSNLFLILVATGRPRINTTFSASLLVLSLPLTVVASLHYGILGAAYAHFIVSFLGLCGISVVFCRAIDMPVGQLLSVAFRPAVASVIMAACAAGLDQASVGHSIANPALKIATLGPLYTAAYIVSIYGLWFAGGKPAGAERTLADLATKKLANWKQRRQKS